MENKYIAYTGIKATIEWYFDANGKCIAREYFRSLTQDRQKKIMHILKLLGDRIKVYNIEKFRHEGDQIYAIKASQDRFLSFFVVGAKIIITNGFEKKSNKLPLGEKNKALKLRLEYIKRVNAGTYYE